MKPTIKPSIFLYSVLLSFFFASCSDSDNEPSPGWDSEWDSELNESSISDIMKFCDITPTAVMWYGERIPLNEANRAMLLEEAAKTPQNILNVKTKAYGSLKETIGSKALEIDKIIINGPVNRADLTYLKHCVANGNLRNIDLSNAILPYNKLHSAIFVTHEYPESPNYTYMSPVFLPLFHISLPKGVTIGDYALCNTLITEIDLTNVDVLMKHAMRRTVFLDNILEIPASITMADQVFIECGNGNLVVNFNTTGVLPCNTFSMANIKEINLAEGLTVVNSYAFCNIKGLKTINLPSTLKRLEYMAIFRNTDLEYLVLPASLEKIEPMALGDLKNLKTLKVLFTDPTVAAGPTSDEDLDTWTTVRDGTEYWAFGIADLVYHPSSSFTWELETAHDVDVYVPAVAYNDFVNTKVWSWFDRIIPE